MALESSGDSSRKTPEPLSFGREHERSMDESLIGRVSRFVSAIRPDEKPVTRYP